MLTGVWDSSLVPLPWEVGLGWAQGSAASSSSQVVLGEGRGSLQGLPGEPGEGLVWPNLLEFERTSRAQGMPRAHGSPVHCSQATLLTAGTSPTPSYPSGTLQLQPSPSPTWCTPGTRPFPGQCLHWLRDMPRSSGAGPHPLKSLPLNLGASASNVTSSKKSSLMPACHPQPEVSSPSLRIPAVQHFSPLGLSPLPSSLRYSSRLPWRLSPGFWAQRGLGRCLLTLPCARLRAAPDNGPVVTSDSIAPRA